MKYFTNNKDNSISIKDFEAKNKNIYNFNENNDIIEEEELSYEENVIENNFKKKELQISDLENLIQSKIACLIRKKYTSLMNEDQKKKNKFMIENILNKRNFNMFINIFYQTLISVISICVYIIGTYFNKDNKEYFQLYIIEIIISGFIIIELIYSFWNETEKKNFFISFLNIIDFITCLPPMINLITKNFNFKLGFLRIIKLIKMLKIFLLYRNSIIENKLSEEGEVQNENSKKKLISAIIIILTMIFIFTGLIHTLNENFPEYFKINFSSNNNLRCENINNDLSLIEKFISSSNSSFNISYVCPINSTLFNKTNQISFDEVFYFMVTTMATVGYGDVYPESSWMRTLISLFVIISIITISKQTFQMNLINKIDSIYLKNYSFNNHIIISGFFNKTSLFRFLSEFYHIDHKEKSDSFKIIIIQNIPPNNEIQSILINPRFEEHIFYLYGDIFSERTLNKANIIKANSIFFLSSNDNIINPQKNDQFIILACKAVSQYTTSKIHAQLNFTQSLLHDWCDWDISFSIQQLKMSVIVKNSFIPGFATMIMNLITSSTTFISSDIVETPWILEYISGASQEIYVIKIPEEFTCPIKFHLFVLHAYMEYGILVLGIKRKKIYEYDNEIFTYEYLINPKIDYLNIVDDEVILIANDFEAASQIFNEKVYRRFINFTEEKRKKKISIYSYKEYNEYKSGNNKNETENDKRESFKNNIEINEQKIDNELKLLKANFKFEDYKKTKFKSKKYCYRNILNNQSSKSQLSFLSKNSNGHSKNSKLKISSKNLFITKRISQKENNLNIKRYFKIWENNSSLIRNYLKNHFIVFCKEEYLWEFLISFNKFYSDTVFYVSDQPPNQKWDVIKDYFQNLIYIESSYSDLDDLEKLNFENAKHVFILSYAIENSNVKDSGILPLVKIIEEKYKNCNYTLELCDELNIRYLTGNITPPFTNYNVDKIPFSMWPKYAKSDIFFSSSLDSLLAFNFFNEGVLEILGNLLGLNKSNHSEYYENNNISSYKYIGEERISYDKIFNMFISLKDPLIPLGVYRDEIDHELSNSSSYVITNPKKELLLNKNDKIICIGKSEDDFDSIDYFGRNENENESLLYFFDERKKEKKINDIKSKDESNNSSSDEIIKEKFDENLFKNKNQKNSILSRIDNNKVKRSIRFNSQSNLISLKQDKLYISHENSIMI